MTITTQGKDARPAAAGIVVDAQDYHYTECGLDNVYISNMPVREDDHGRMVVRIPAIGLLHAVIAYELSIRDGAWSGKELRFIRTELGMTQAKLADLVHKDRVTVNRWEGGADIDANAETLIRIAMLEHLEGAGLFELLDLADPPGTESLSDSARPGATNPEPVRLTLDDGVYRAEPPRVAA